MRRANCGPQHLAGFRVTDALVRRFAGCLSGGGKSRERAASARRAALILIGLRTTKRALHRRETSLFRCKTVVRRESCDLQRAAGTRVARERAPLRWLCLRRWRNMRACRARAPCRTGCDRLPRYERALHRRKISLLGRKTVVRRASCGLHRAAGTRVAREQAPLRCLSLGRWQNTRACHACAPCRAGCDRPTRYGRPLCRWEASPLRCKTVVRRASCGLQRAAGIHVARAQAPLRWLSLGGGKTREFAAREHRAALVVIDICGIEGQCTGERPLSFGARPWCDVRAMTSNT